MTTLSGRARIAEWSLAAWLLAAFLLLLLIGGGASRSDVAGQIVVRTGAFAILVTIALVVDRGAARSCGAVPWLLAAIIALPLLQLVPLPPGLWRSLPGRAELLEALPVSVQDAWRPLSLSPGNTVNAAISLIVPAAVLALLSLLRPQERRWLPATVLALVVLSMVVGLLQFTGVHVEQRLINSSVDVRGTFANRNHFALLLAIGSVIVPYIAMSSGRRHRWLKIAGVGLALLLQLIVLASGSRMGLLLSLIAVVLGGLVMRDKARRAWQRRSPALMAVVAGAAILVGTVIASAVYLDRAVSVERLSQADVGQDMRVRAFPTVIEMVKIYAPVGTGLGSFDPMFRRHEPFDLLKPTYFNRAHNDFLEVVLDAGAPGALLIAIAVVWWSLASWRAWRRPADDEVCAARIGSAAILLAAVASIVDYPARTPLVMAILVISATMLAWGARKDFGAVEDDGRR